MGLVILVIAVVVIMAIAKRDKGEKAPSNRNVAPNRGGKIPPNKKMEPRGTASLREKAEEAIRSGNVPMAERYYVDAANAGDAEAMYYLGLQYGHDSRFGLDEEKSLYWLKRAVSAGKIEAIYHIALTIHMHGDAEMAFQWAQNGASRGDVRCKQFLADNYYAIATSVHYNKGKAITLLEEAISSVDDRDVYGGIANSLGMQFGRCFVFGQEAPDAYANRKKACYCFLLSFFADTDYDTRKQCAQKTGYWPTEAEWNQWVQDARQLAYRPQNYC